MPSLIWYSSDGDVVDDTFSSSKTGVHNTMKIDVLTKKHFGKVYVCGAANNNRTKPAFANVTIDMKRESISPIFHRLARQCCCRRCK